MAVAVDSAVAVDDGEAVGVDGGNVAVALGARVDEGIDGAALVGEAITALGVAVACPRAAV